MQEVISSCEDVSAQPNRFLRPLRVLSVVDGDPNDRVERAAAQSSSIHLVRCTSNRLRDHLQGQESIDAVWVTVQEFDLKTSGMLEYLKSFHPKVAVILLLPAEGGVQGLPDDVDHVSCDQSLSAFRLIHATRHASYRSQLPRKGATPATLDARAVGSRELPVTSRLYGQVALRDARPSTFEEVVEDYRSVLAVGALPSQVRDEDPLSQALQQIARTLGFLRATHQDVIQIHSTCMVRLLDEASGVDRGECQERARRLVLELMGHLVTYYRDQCAGSDLSRPPEGHARVDLDGGSGSLDVSLSKPPRNNSFFIS